jgi:hypothetical protein
MEDTELREQFQSINQKFDSINQKFESMTTLIVNVKESLEREIGIVRERVDRMDTRLAKIAAGAGYVTRLVEWSEKQDRFQDDILQRVQKLEGRLDKLDGNGRKSV